MIIRPYSYMESTPADRQDEQGKGTGIIIDDGALVRLKRPPFDGLHHSSTFFTGSC
jgi:hypothetical protein